MQGASSSALTYCAGDPGGVLVFPSRLSWIYSEPGRSIGERRGFKQIPSPSIRCLLATGSLSRISPPVTETSPSLSLSDSNQKVRSSAILSGTDATLGTLSDTDFAGEVSGYREGNGVPICLMAAALDSVFCCNALASIEQLLAEDARDDLVLAGPGKRFTAGGSVLDEKGALGGVVFVFLKCPIFSKRLAVDLGDSQAQNWVSPVCRRS